MSDVTGKPGYDFDPFEGEISEDFFVGRFIAKFTRNPDGFCSTAREWHILLSAIDAGLAATTLGNVPDCPPKWVDEQQYWNLPSKITNCIKCQWPGALIILSGLFTLKTAGVV